MYVIYICYQILFRRERGQSNQHLVKTEFNAFIVSSSETISLRDMELEEILLPDDRVPPPASSDDAFEM